MTGAVSFAVQKFLMPFVHWIFLRFLSQNNLSFLVLPVCQFLSPGLLIIWVASKFIWDWEEHMFIGGRRTSKLNMYNSRVA